MMRIQVNQVPWSLASEADMTSWKQLDASFMSYDPYYVRLPNQVVSPSERLEIILSHPSLLIRATDLAKFISKCPPEALKDNFRLMVNRIFSNGEREQQPWDLRSLRKADYPNESAAVLKLLAADGPLINLALRLMDDHSFLLEFPLEQLPIQLQKKLRETEVPPFFANKLGIAQQGFGIPRGVTNLLLNPFEYYMFAFTSINIMGVNAGRAGDYLNGWAALQDTLYTNVLDEYLSYYFPCNGTGVPGHNFNYNVNQAKEAVFLANSLLRQQQQPKSIKQHGLLTYKPMPDNYQDNKLPKLFKSSVLQEQHGAAVNPRENLFLTTHPSAYKEVWRSETMLHVFMELWMCGYHGDGVLDKDNFCSTSPMIYGGLPSVEVVKSIRMLVRHLHYFINCVNSHAMHPMEEIRRTAFPIFQRRLYTFLRYLFHHWPLDNSFRIVYETWLSYIQPWRYVVAKNVQSDAADIPVDRRWFNFIIENILFYSKILSQMLLRLERVDLTATKNALMFYRLAKVFTTQENLKLMLHEIEFSIKQYEKQLEAAANASSPNVSTANLNNSTIRPHFSKYSQNLPHGSPRPGGYSTPTAGRTAAAVPTVGSYFGGGRLSPIVSSPGSGPASPSPAPSMVPDYSGVVTTANSVKIAHIKQMMKDLENVQYAYEPIFSAENIAKVQFMLKTSSEARDYLLTSAEKLTKVKEPQKGLASFTAFLSSIWAEASSDNSVAIANAAEKTKAANHLEFSRNQFAEFFDMQLNETSRISPTESNGFGFSSGTESPLFGNSFCQSPQHSVLKTSARFPYPGSQSLFGANDTQNSFVKKVCLPAGVLVEADTIPHGNPDTALARSDESRTLVRWFYNISSFYNYVFEDQINQIYFSSTWSGRYLRAMLAEPTEYIVSEKKRGPSRFENRSRKVVRKARYLPPRVHLRVCASHMFWAWIFVIFLFCVIFRLGFLGSFFTLLMLSFIYLTFRATSEPLNKLEELKHLKELYADTEDEYVIDAVSPPTTASNSDEALFPSTISSFGRNKQLPSSPSSPRQDQPREELLIHRRNFRFGSTGDGF